MRGLCACGCGQPTTIATKTYRRTGAVKGLPLRYLPHHHSTRHGATKDRKANPEYICWNGMIQRCTNPRNPSYKHYGGRGIKVCERWAQSFETFLADMGRKPSRQHSIDRIDNDAGYDPENCAWRTPAEQQRNRRVTKLTEADVQEIRASLASGVPHRRLANLHNVSHSHISRIGSGAKW